MMGAPSVIARLGDLVNGPLARAPGSDQSSRPRGFVASWLPSPISLVFVVLMVCPVRGGGFDRAVETVLPRVVKLYGLGVGTQAGYGSGVLVSADGLLLTVFSLLIDSENIRAVTSDGTIYGADVVYRDPARQLALLKLKKGAAGGAAQDNPAGTGAQRGGENESQTGPRPIGPFQFFDLTCADAAGGSAGGSDASCLASLKPGDWVLAAGNSFKVADGMEAVSVFRGVLSARTQLDARRKVKDFPYHGDVLAIDAITSNPGAPGSAVVDVEGRFVGMIGRVVISNRTHTHFNYAIPRDVLWNFMCEATDPRARAAARLSRQPIEEGEAATLDLGMRMARAGYRDLPPFVERVRSGSPAERAGVQKDDLILSINGSNVADVRGFDERWRTLKAGEPVDLLIRRGRRIMNVRIDSEKPR